MWACSPSPPPSVAALGMTRERPGDSGLGLRTGFTHVGLCCHSRREAASEGKKKKPMTILTLSPKHNDLWFQKPISVFVLTHAFFLIAVTIAYVQFSSVFSFLIKELLFHVQLHGLCVPSLTEVRSKY